MNPNQALWEKGDFTHIAASMRQSGRSLVDTLSITSGMRVLDLGCGDGTTALPAARLGAEVTGVDISTTLVEAGNRRAREAGLTNIRFQWGDACNLDGIPDGGFDLVVSMFGAMFAPKPFDVAKAMVRVTRPGGRIVMGNWIPNDPTLVAQILRISASYSPPPPDGFVSPMAWGVENQVVERFAAADIPKDSISFARDTYGFDFPGRPSAFLDEFRHFYGPTMNAFEAAEKERARRRSSSGAADAVRESKHGRGEHLDRGGISARDGDDPVVGAAGAIRGSCPSCRLKPCRNSCRPAARSAPRAPRRVRARHPPASAACPRPPTGLPHPGNRRSGLAKYSVMMKPRTVRLRDRMSRIRAGQTVGALPWFGPVVVLRDQPADGDARERVEQREHRVPHGTADVLEIDVDAVRARGGEAFGEIRRPVIDRGVEPQLVRHERQFALARRDADRLRPPDARDLADDRADRPARGGDDHRLARLRTADIAEAGIGREPRHPEHAECGRRQRDARIDAAQSRCRRTPKTAATPRWPVRGRPPPSRNGATGRPGSPPPRS